MSNDAAPSEGTTAAGTVTTMDAKTAREGLEDLQRELVHGTDEQLRSFLDYLADFQAAAFRTHGIFPRRSTRNVAMLEAQRRRLGESHKLLYAGPRQWETLGRAVRDTAVPKFISAHSGPKAKREDDDTSGTTSGGTAASGTTGTAVSTTPAKSRTRSSASYGFVTVVVYDYTDTVATNPDDPEPTWALPMSTGQVDVLDRLVSSSPVPVTFTDLAARNENGFLDDAGATVDMTMPVGNQIATLAHELVHHYAGHRTGKRLTEDERARAEQEAGLGQWLVMRMLGLDESAGNPVTKAAAAYLRSWTDEESGKTYEGHRKRFSLIAKRLDRALAAANKVVEGYLAVGTESTDAADTATPESDSAADAA